MGGTRPACDGLRLADLACLHGTEQGKELIELHLGDAHVVQEILGKGLELLRGLHHPLQHRVRVHFEHPGDRADAQPFGQGAHGPHQQVGRDALAMKQRPVRFEHVAATAGAIQLAPGAAVGMTVGTDIAQPHPAPIGTVRMGAEVRRRVHLARAAARGHDAGWRATGRLGSMLVGLLTGGTGGLAGEARKGCRLAAALAPWWRGLRWCQVSSSTVAWPHPLEHEAQPYECDQRELVEKKMRYHGKTPS